MKQIVWIASYPKSGNTWFRLFLTRLLGDSELRLDRKLVTIDDGLGIAADRTIFDSATGLASSDLLPGEIERLRPRVYEAVAGSCGAPVYMKVHDAWHRTADAEPLLPTSVTRAAVYIVRNPLAFHRSESVDATIAAMADENFAIGRTTDALAFQLRQYLSSWSGHVRSWLAAPDLKRHVMRYEDMVARPVETFSSAVAFLELPGGATAIRDALDACRFERLRAEEETRGFVEKPQHAARFFREGRVGGWRSHLTEMQIGRIIADHREVMRSLDYIDAEGRARF
jgi:hypothetical protein